MRLRQVVQLLDRLAQPLSGDLAAAEGLLMLQAGPDVLRFVPALNIDDAALAEGLARLARALRAFAKNASPL